MAEETQNQVAESKDVADENHHLGPILGVLIVLLVLVLGGLYIWGAKLAEEQGATTVPREIENNEPETPRAEADAEIFTTTSSSDELDAIEADIESTNLDSIDAELTTMEQEIDGDVQ